MARAARTTVVRRSPLVLVAVVIVVAALALLAATARPAALLARRGLDRVRELLQAEPDPALVGIHADHQQGQLVADAHDLVGAADRPAGHLGDVQQAVDAGLELDEGAEVGQTDDLAGDPRAHRGALGDGRPRVGLDLLEPERDALVLLVHVEDLRLELLPLLEDLRGVADAPRPGHVRDVQQAVHPGLQLDERAEVGQVAHPPHDARTRLVALLDRLPRVGLHLLHAERDPLAGPVDVEHDHLDLVADVDELGGVPDPARPRHLGDVHEALDAGLQLDEGAVVGEAHDPAARARAGRVRLLHALPRVGGLLLVAQGHPPGLAVEVQHDDLDLVPDLEDLRRVADAAPAHVGHVQEAVDAAEGDEGAVVGDVLHGAREDHALGEHLERVLLLLLALLLEDRAAREHDVAAAPVELDDLGADRLPHHREQVLHGAQVDLGAREKRLHPDVDREPALHDLHDPPLDWQALLERLGDRVPDLDLVGLVLREDDQPLGVLLGLEVDLDLVAHAGQRPVPLELLDRDRALALVAHVDEHLARADVDDAPADDLAFLELAGRGLAVPVLHPFLGRLSALLVRTAEVAPWFVRHHPARSSSSYDCSRAAESCGRASPWAATVSLRRAIAAIISRLARPQALLRPSPRPP